MPESLGIDVHLSSPYAEVLERTISALKAEGFGVLTRIDVHEAFQEKLGLGFRPYTILGACNPALAHTALTAVPEVGLMLPCNVVVEEAGDAAALVRIANPRALMTVGSLGDDERLCAVADDAYARLLRVAEALRAAG